MKQYPSIPTKPTGNCSAFWVFDKLDGSNIRVEWSKKNGFSKFGSRKRLLGSDQGLLQKSEQLALNQEKHFRDVFDYQKIDKAICFFEFVGQKSFAGSHVENDEHQLILIDLDVYKQGLVSPAKFLEIFTPSSVKIPKMLYYGLIDESFRQEVRESKLPGMTFEGVVAKAYNKRSKKIEMFKIKSNAWISAVKAKYGDNSELLNYVL